MVKVAVINTNEELMIARDVMRWRCRRRTSWRCRYKRRLSLAENHGNRRIAVPLCATAKVSGKVKTWPLHNVPPRAENLSGAGSSAAKLVSCPVDWYSTVEVETGTPRNDERPLSRAMVDQLLAHWGYPAALSQQIRITLHSTIPVAKGMASSTADIAATAAATAHHLGHALDEPTLARLCVALEPTDSTLFRQLTLFDHNTAATQIACPAPPALDLLVLESPLTLRTTDYHQLPREPVCWLTPPAAAGVGESTAGLPAR